MLLVQVRYGLQSMLRGLHGMPRAAWYAVTRGGLRRWVLQSCKGEGLLDTGGADLKDGTAGGSERIIFLNTGNSNAILLESGGQLLWWMPRCRTLRSVLPFCAVSSASQGMPKAKLRWSLSLAPTPM